MCIPVCVQVTAGLYTPDAKLFTQVVTETWENKVKNKFWTEHSKGSGYREAESGRCVLGCEWDALRLLYKYWASSVNKEQRLVQLVCDTLPYVLFKIIVCNYSHLIGAEFCSHVDDIAAVTVGEVTS